MPESRAETDALAEAVADLRLWLHGQRSMTNYIVGSLGGHEGDSEIERRLIWEADNAQIIARAAIVNAEAARVTRPAPRCDACFDTRLVDWMIEADPSCSQEPDCDGKIPCPDCVTRPDSTGRPSDA